MKEKTPEFKKVKNNSARSCYEVSIGRKVIGLVWSVVGFSYLGSQGWNRGFRLRDFHPIEWGYVVGGELPVTLHRSAHYCNRRIATSALMDAFQRGDKS